MKPTTFLAGIVLTFCVGAAIIVSVLLGPDYQRWGYLFTLFGGFLAALCAFRLYYRARRVGGIVRVHTIILTVFFTFYGLEELGWALWRSGIRPEWFEDSLTGFSNLSRAPRRPLMLPRPFIMSAVISVSN